jgi:hypothetical protein
MYRFAPLPYSISWLHLSYVKIWIDMMVYHFMWLSGLCVGSVVVQLKWRILNNKEIYAIVKKPTITETIRLYRLCWFGHVQRMEGNGIPKRVLYMNLESTRPRSRPRNRLQDEVREDGRTGTGGGEEWQEKVYNREKWKRLLRTARNCRILHMVMGLNE